MRPLLASYGCGFILGYLVLLMVNIVYFTARYLKVNLSLIRKNSIDAKNYFSFVFISFVFALKACLQILKFEFVKLS